MEVSVWAHTVTQLHPEHMEILHPDERSRWNRYLDRSAADRFALGAVLLRLVASAALGLAPDDVSVDRTCSRCGAPHGRPIVAGFGAGATSVSHSGPLVVVALAELQQPPTIDIGVDVEVLRQLDFRPLLPHVLGVDEPAPSDLRGFLELWTGKEAVLKAMGVGLRRPMTTFALDDGRGTAAAGSVQLVDLDLGDDVVGAVAARGTRSLSVTRRAHPGLV